MKQKLTYQKSLCTLVKGLVELQFICSCDTWIKSVDLLAKTYFFHKGFFNLKIKKTIENCLCVGPTRCQTQAARNQKPARLPNRVSPTY